MTDGRATARYASIDFLRGTAVVLMFLVSRQNPFAQLRHGSWNAPTVADLVYPGFLMIVGISMELSSGRALETGAPLAKKFFRRAGTLFFIGVLLLSLTSMTLRFNMGTLQGIAVASIVAFPSVQLRAAGRIGYAVILALFLCVVNGGDWSQETSFAVRLDEAVLGKFKGVEGIFSSIGGAVFIVYGLVFGWMLRTKTSREFNVSTALCAGGLFLAALALSEVIPVVPDLFSASYIVQAAAILSGVATLTVFAIETLNGGRAPRLICQIGLNAMAVFVGVKVFQELVLNHAFGAGTVADTLRAAVRNRLGDDSARLSVAVVKLAVAAGLARLLARSGIRVRI